MKNLKNNLFVISLALIMLTIISCEQEDPKIYGCTDSTSTNYNPSATDDDGSCKYEGDVTFWYNSNGTEATVIVDGKVGYITKYYETYDPSCGSSGCANFTLPVGSYSYSASSTWSSWSGTVTVSANRCTMMLLH